LLPIFNNAIMEVFVHNLPKNRSRRKVRNAIRKAIKETLFSRIEYEWIHFPRNRALGTILFPQAYMAQEFLNNYRHGLSMLGRTVKFAPSNRPLDTKLVESLRRKMEENNDDSESENERIGEVSQGTTLEEESQLSVYRHPHRFEPDVQRSLLFTSLEYGVWNSNGTFGCCGKLERGGGYITYNRDTAKLNIEGLMADGESALYRETGMSIDNGTIKEILVDRNNSRLFLTLSRIPRFWSQNKGQDLTPANPNLPTEADTTQRDLPSSTWDSEEFVRALDRFDFTGILDDEDDEQPRFRLTALSAEHAPYAPFSTVYVFNLAGKFDTLLRRLFKSMRRRDFVDKFVRISTVDLAFIDEFQGLQSRFSRYDFRIAFQLESFVRNCFLLPSDVRSLEPQIGSLVEMHGVQHSIRLLQQFNLSLPLRTYDSLSRGSKFTDLLDEVISGPLRREPRADPNSVWVHRFDLTPAAFNMEGPLLMGSNRILRLYPNHHDHFLKVSFVEEDLTTIRFDRDLDISLVIKNRWRTIFGHPSSDPNLRHDSSQYWSSENPDTPNWLKQGLRVAGRDFEFLGFSSSSLKEHSAWFISPFEYNGEAVTGDSLRSALGNFSHIRCPPLYAARLGQTFTVTSHSLAITPDQVDRIEDVSIPDISDPFGQKKLVFSDGVGTMSQSMLTRIWEDTIPQTHFDIKPVVYQIRLGGSKGVLSLDPTLQGSKVCLRPSMTKFNAQNLTLELANKGRTLPFFLNRQIIILLETLGLERANFLTLLTIEVSKLEIASTDFEEARKLCQRYNLGQTSRFPKILKTLQLWAVPSIFEMPFFRRLLWLALMFALKQIKYRARIAVEDNSWTLMGIMDEFNVLAPGEIYVCMKDEVYGRPRYLTGETLVTRMPALHCGDMQYVNAVGPVDSNNPLSALYNCVVFSSRGPRPIPNMLSGGDLDGDLYQITQNPLLFPPSTDEPDAYPSVDRKELDRDCKMADIADFFVDFIVNDRIGQISNMHVIHSDKSPLGARDPECIQLSRLAAQATDFPKTGHAVDMRNAPRVASRPKPDFMAERSRQDEDLDGPQEHQQRDNNLYYASQKVLGEMYRSIHIQKLLQDWNVDWEGNEDAPMELWRDIETKMTKVKPPYQTHWAGYVSAAESMFDHYLDELFIIMRQFHPKPWSGERLKEEEVFLQCIEMDMSKRNRGRGRYDFLHSMRMEYGDLIETVLETSGTERDRFLRFCACFFVGITAPRKRRDKNGESFAWLVISELFESYQKLEKTGFEEEEEDEESVVDYEGFDPYDQSAVYPKGGEADDTLRETMRRFGVLRI
jgi:RNA dependent RNA polymerase